MATATDIRVMVPRVRRSVEGVGSEEGLTDGQMKDLVADSIADVILYTGGAFGKELLVVHDTDGVPDEYETSDALTLPEQSVIATQAALNHFFHKFAGLKIAEEIADEAQRWSYSRSAQLLAAQLQHLIKQRDDALAQLEEDQGGLLESYTSFLAVRDAEVSMRIEPWVAGHLSSGQEDYRFGTLG